MTREGGYSSGTKTFGDVAEYTINFPLYDGVKELYIGLKKGALLEAPSPYKYSLPVVFYGNHPNDFGFLRFAQYLEPILKPLL